MGFEGVGFDDRPHGALERLLDIRTSALASHTQDEDQDQRSDDASEPPEE